MVRVAVMATALAACDTGPVQAQQHPPPVGLGRAVGQTGAGVLGMAAGFVGGGLATRWAAERLGASDDRASSIALGAAYVGGALGAAAGPTIVGPGSHPAGQYWGAVAGSVAGGIGSFLIARLNRAVNLGSLPRVVSAVAVVALPAVGATVGYNLSRPR